ncbi:TOBE domain-containing protein [Arenibacter lacus]|uniref:TOBE domain-containing protein n=1 Tax=Arenibacter lacus TaxID=2608629 RepID=UPI00123D643A|nr:TOBE domain-containing protein [Arenibacter lacus]
MNSFKGHILEVETVGNLSLVRVALGKNTQWVSVVLDTPQTAPYLVPREDIRVLFKETEVILNLQDPNLLSVDNYLKGTVKEVEAGEILSRLVLDTEIGELVAVVGSKSLKRLGLDRNMSVLAMVKMNELILAP